MPGDVIGFLLSFIHYFIYSHYSACADFTVQRANYDDTYNFKCAIMQEKNLQNVLFISRLQSAMKSKKLKQKDLGYMANIGQSAVSAYLSGRRSPGAAELSRMSQALGVSMGWLWGLEEESQQEQSKIQQENILLRAKLDMAISTLKGTLKSLTSNKL